MTVGKERSTAAAVENCACCLGGLLVAVAVAVLFYEELVALTRPLELLSSTALVFLLVLVWDAAWLGLEVLWEWQAGRLLGVE